MSSRTNIGLPEALERAAAALPADADGIRPANGDPFALLSLLDSEATTRVLEWLLIHEPDAGAELVTVWADAGGDAAEPLKRIETGSLPKAAQKVLRRAHHRLRSRGESVPQPDRGPVVATLPKVVDELNLGLITAIDPSGTRMAYLVEANPSGGARMFVAALNEERGVVEFDVFNAGRSKIKQFIRDVTQGGGHPAIDTPPDSIRALIERIADYQPEDRPLPRAFSEWRQRIARPAPGTATPGELALAALDPSEEKGGEALSRAVELARERKVGPWPAKPEILQEVAQRLKDVSTGVVIVSGEARQEQVETALDEARGRIFDAEFSRRTGERFEEAAYVFWKNGREEDARACLAASRAFREEAPESHPIARAMLEVVMAPVLTAAEEKPSAESDPSLLVRP
jgi:hypothetical protein